MSYQQHARQYEAPPRQGYRQQQRAAEPAAYDNNARRRSRDDHYEYQNWTHHLRARGAASPFRNVLLEEFTENQPLPEWLDVVGLSYIVFKKAPEVAVDGDDDEMQSDRSTSSSSSYSHSSGSTLGDDEARYEERLRGRY